ncbi:uncharacterized protein [Amphiura filiformis]|uniref:uncharacterized protein n=1 Tax=Amphiura filiformis TaxID=82378 RepID=UPI003B2133A0
MRLDEQIRAYRITGEMTIKLQEEFEASKKMLMEMADSMDNRTTEAEEKLSELQEETKEAQKLAGKYQEKYESERHKNQETMSSQNSSNSSGSSNLNQRRSKSALPRPAEIDSRYMSVVEENSKLRNEVKRLRDDNKDLVKKTKGAIKDVDFVQQHIATCTAQKFELQKRLHKEQEQNRRLSANMTKQAADWVTEKKMTKTSENTGKIKNIHSESVFDGPTRLKSHHVKMNEDRPRDIPVHNW